MNVLVTGAGGQLGYDILKELYSRNIKFLGVDKQDFDITDYDAVQKCIKTYMPDVVIHCSAYTAVEKAEDEPEICRKVNVYGTENIAKVCKEINAKLLYISTDYVFSGIGTQYYKPEDEQKPKNVYGQTKLDGERVVKKLLDKYFIVRTSWVFGINGNNFVKTMLQLGKNRKEIDVVADQIGSPTYTVDLAILLCNMIETEKYGIYHATNEGVCSWAEFAESIFEIAGLDIKVNYVTTKQYPTKAKRPKNSRLSKEKLIENGFDKLPSWKDAGKRYIESVIKNI